jgi:indolepyruvate decarboxylase
MSSSASRRMKIGDFLLRRLEEAGVRHLFGVPGDYNLELLQQLQDTGALKWIGTCSELNASYAGAVVSTAEIVASIAALDGDVRAVA